MLNPPKSELIKVAHYQAKTTATRADYWQEYLRILWNEVALDDEDDYGDLREMSLWASTFAYIEWLANFYLLPKQGEYPKIHAIAGMLQATWQWDIKIAEIFWKAGRHPIAHVGFANPFYSYGKLDGLSTNILFNNSKWSAAELKEWEKRDPFRGVVVIAPNDKSVRPIQTIIFTYQILLDELLPKLAISICDSIAQERDPTKIAQIESLSKRISTLIMSPEELAQALQ